MKLELAVCDTGPLLYLTLIEELEILTKLFARILLPATVREELIHPKAPTVVRQVFGAPPPWLRIQSVDSGHTSGIQLAEAHAIHLAKISSADMLLIDDAAGRRAAAAAGLKTMGTIGTLEQAAFDDLLDLESSFARLQATNFFGSSKLFEAALDRHEQRKKQKPRSS